MDEYVNERFDTVLFNVQQIPIDHEYGSDLYNLAVAVQEIIDCIRILHSDGGPTVEQAPPQ